MNYLTLLLKLYRLKRNINKSTTQIEKMQMAKFQKLVRYAYRNSEYYRRVFQEAGIREENIESREITDFPTIDKKIFLEHFNELITVKGVTQEELRFFDEIETIEKRAYKENYHLVHSSGSTGKPAYFLYDKSAWNTMLLGIIRAALWNMSMLEIIKFLKNRPRIIYIAATDGRYGGAMAVGDGIDGLHMEQLHLNIQSPIHEWIEAVTTFRPNLIIGYPSAIKILGDLVGQGEISLSITRVITCGEPLHPHISTFFQQVFECEVVNVYGASESLAMGVGVTGEAGISLFDDMNLIEIEEEEIYLTCLYNYAQPVIRYRLSDQLNIMRESRSNIPFTKVETILGRSEELLWFEDENGHKEFLHPLAVEGICVEGLKDYQFREINKSAFEMLAEVEDEVNQEVIEEKILKMMKPILNEKKLSYVQFNVRFVNSIKPDSYTGKKKLIIKEEVI